MLQLCGLSLGQSDQAQNTAGSDLKHFPQLRISKEGGYTPFAEPKLKVHTKKSFFGLQSWQVLQTKMYLKGYEEPHHVTEEAGKGIKGFVKEGQARKLEKIWLAQSTLEQVQETLQDYEKISEFFSQYDKRKQAIAMNCILGGFLSRFRGAVELARNHGSGKHWDSEKRLVRWANNIVHAAHRNPGDCDDKSFLIDTVGVCDDQQHVVTSIRMIELDINDLRREPVKPCLNWPSKSAKYV